MFASARRWLPVALIVLVAFWLRTYDIAQRPMHADEANQALKTGQLIESGRYTFDPRDHHGPTLYYAAVPVAWIRGQATLAALSEGTLRLVPAVFGTASVLLLALLALPLGRGPALAAAAFLAVSPPAVYYSRYFIQETLLATLLLAALVCTQRWWRHGRLCWAIAAGACAGLMQATKGSAPLFALGALVAALVAGAGRPASTRPWRDGAIAAATALLIAAFFFTSFGRNLSGAGDALAAYHHAWTRVSGPSGHEKPWWYYLRLFAWHREGGLVWEQVAFSVLAACGLAGVLAATVRKNFTGGAAGRSPLAGAGLRSSPANRLTPIEPNPLASRFARWAAVYTLLVAVAFSLSPYKTPWHAIHFVPGMALLAASAIAAIGRLRTGRVVAVLFVGTVVAALAAQTRLVAFLRPADARNPFAYVHSSPDVVKARALVEAALARSPGQPVRIISEEYWPLPWYLRGLPNIGYWPAPTKDCDGALIIASASQAADVRSRLHGPYRESFLGLRPGFLCIIFTPDS